MIWYGLVNTYIYGHLYGDTNGTSTDMNIRYLVIYFKMTKNHRLGDFLQNEITQGERGNI